jgi:hypothetical protein
MKKMNKIPASILILFALLITGLFYSESSGSLKWDDDASKEQSEGSVKNAQVKDSVLKQEAIIRPNIEYKSQGLKDPFQPLVTEEETGGSIAANSAKIKPLPVLTIQALIWGGAFPQAIINNRIVKIGDKISEAEVIAIGKEGVTLLYANKKYKLSSPALMGSRKEKQTEGGNNEKSN